MKTLCKKIIALLMTGMIVSSPVMAEDSVFGGAGTDAGLNVGEEESGDIIALDDLNISIVADNYTAIRQDDGFVYVYTDSDGAIPYVIIGRYDFESESFADDFTDYMSGQYDDLDVNSLREGVEIGDHTFDIVTYEYSISGYDASDTRMFTVLNGATYMFGTKGIEELGMVIPDGYLDSIAGSFQMLAGGDSDYPFHVDAERSVEKEKTDLVDFGSAGADVIGEEVEEVEEDKGVQTAEEETNKVLFKESMASYDGTWLPFDDGFKIYVPSDWNEYEVPEDQKEGGCFYQAGDKNVHEDPTAPYIAVNYSEIDGIDTLDEVAEALEEAGYSIEGIVNLNGMECVSYSMESPDLSGMMFFHPERHDYVFAVIGYNYTVNRDLLSALLCSLSPK